MASASATAAVLRGVSAAPLMHCLCSKGAGADSLASSSGAGHSYLVSCSRISRVRFLSAWSRSSSFSPGFMGEAETPFRALRRPSSLQQLRKLSEKTLSLSPSPSPSLLCRARSADIRNPEPRRYRGGLHVIGVVSAVLGIASLAAVALILNSGGPTALFSMVSKSGFPAAFALIFVSEIGDKTFFIAALLAMRQNKWLVLVGASGALAVMTVISVVIGKLFQKLPAQLQTTLPVGEYAAVALLIWFGLRSIKNAWAIPSAPAGVRSQPEEIGELAEAEEFLKQTDDKKATTPLEVLGEAFTLIFVAEWGDRSMLATIALGAAQSPWGVASGAIAGHVLATLLAIVGGALLARYLSEKLIGYLGGYLFLGFAAATLAGVF